ncbi:hypothetical protein [Aquabacterium sp. OR-4]|uniref:hypothetical protein n=1 Tax=Aquabacterium sp. OR-4 TaxID=2978127 RepID=UPI0028CA7633|nr:hypothetical protein [Aquabacterium sp. OR-4]MDT7838015.1 hypothetical protein [Aquabacterium sp. OR-4]
MKSWITLVKRGARRAGVQRRLARALLTLGLVAPCAAAADPTVAPAAPGSAGAHYLFAHMTSERYGVLHYAISQDGLHWQRLNGGQPVSPDYRGHPSIVQGHDGRYYLVGNRSDDDPEIRFWVSDDLVRWSPLGSHRPDLASTPGYPHPMQRIGAPKLYYDAPSRRYLLTWHTPNVPGTPDDPERYWASQHTLYLLSPDLQQFEGPPRRLFAWPMATIDVFMVANPEGGYCAVLKDERFPSYLWTTGKTIRMSCAPALLGPYPEPGPPLSPAFREAPTLIRAPNGLDWLLYYEQYAGTSYGLSMAPRLQGPWIEAWGNSGVAEWNRFEMPPGLRHGFMMAITRPQYEALRQAYPVR